MAKFEFHSVGQGLFYSGQINNFNFVFDIGSLNKSYLTREINTYIKKIPNTDVDYVFLSHLDKDHISGLVYLMARLHKTKNKVKNIVLPYIPGFSSLYLLLSKNGTSVYPISNNDDNNNDDNMVREFSSQSIAKKINKSLLRYWKFSVFYVKPKNITSNTLNKLNSALVNPYIQKTLTKRIFVNLKKSTLWTNKDLKNLIIIFDALTSKSNRNMASLNVVHGPICKGNNINKATVLTGDSDWNTNGMLYINWLKKNMNNLNSVKFLQVPHHGSINNWNTKIKDWAHKQGFSSITAVVSTGHYKNWNHPHKKVKYSLRTCSRSFKIVDAVRNYIYII